MTNINPKLETARRALTSIPKYRFAIDVVESDGKIEYVNKVTGQSFDEISDAFDSVNVLGLIDFRIFSSATSEGPFNNFSVTRGANQLASEVKVVNDFLREAASNPVKMQQLTDVGLGHLAGTSIGAKFYKSNTQNNQKGVIQALDQTIDESRRTTVSITDEGYSILEYFSESGLQLTGEQSKLLKSVVGASPIRKEYLSKLFKKVAQKDGSKNWADVAKIAKRMQSYISPRDFSIGETFISQFLDQSKITYAFGGDLYSLTSSMSEADRAVDTLDAFGIPSIRHNILFQDRMLVIDRVASKLEAAFSGNVRSLEQSERQYLNVGSGDGLTRKNSKLSR